LAIASYNVSNLSPGDEPARFAAVASQIVNNLAAPDIITLQGIQDNSGPTNDGTVSASDTYQALIEAITAAGGPTYDFREIAPEDLQDGGEPGANPRVGFLFRPDRVTFVDRGNATATEATSVTLGATGLELSLSPGRIDPTNSAFTDTSKSLVGEFLFNGQKIFVINNHFNSRQDDDPLFGSVQPPVRHSEIQRTQSAQVINDFVDDILSQDTETRLIVLGDLNDFPFSQPISDTLTAGVLTNLAGSLPAGDQYTFILDGNSQMLDYILVSGSLNQVLAGFDVVHTNAEFSVNTRPGDHDPILARFSLPSKPYVYLPFISK
jgi:predicted extracellular nuclease